MIPVNTFMKHLLEVQGLDPNAVPGEKALKALQQAMDETIEKHHAKDFDDDYEFGPFYQHYQEARKKLAGLTKDKFKKLTDLSNLPFGPGRYPTSDEEQEFFQRCHQLNSVASEVPKKELPLYTKAGRQAYREKVIKDLSNKLIEDNNVAVREIIDPIIDLRKTLEAVGLTEPKKGIKTSKKKANKKTARVVKVSNRTIFGRTEMHERLVKKMVANGLCKDSPEALSAQIQEMGNWDEGAFEAMESIVNKYATSKNVDGKFKGLFRRSPVTKGE
jgi:hypothetical protein